MAIDKLGLYNAALRLMGERRLANLSENREPRRVLDGVWADDAIGSCLEQGQWSWASRSLKMEATPSEVADFGYKYVFQKPDDYVRVITLCNDEYFSSSLNRFVDEGDYFYVDNDTIYLRYVSDGINYGRNYALWPQSFQRYVIAFMAYEASLRLTNSHAIQDRLELQMKRRLSDAQAKDGVNRPVQYPPRGSWLKARQGNSSYRTLEGRH